MKRKLTIIISGRVQGVFFRDNAKKLADELKIAGLAKNLSDGRVEIQAQGDESSLRKLLDWCYRGSFLARVEGLSFVWSEPTRKYIAFEIDREGKSYLEDKAAALYQLSRELFNNSYARLPKHLVIIPDGNRRWAKEHNLPSWQGHQQGFDRAQELLKEIRGLGIRYATLWGFSTENWSRSQVEVGFLMGLFSNMVEKIREDAFQYEISFHHFGRKDRLPKNLALVLAKLEEKTRKFSKYHFGLALDYGGRDEILRAMEKIHTNRSVNETVFSKALDTSSFPDPEFIIRTGGEQRLSGIMPWQGVYAELYFSPLYFPDFNPTELRLALEDYSQRDRRFGK